MPPFIDANVIVKAFTYNRERNSCQSVLRNSFVTDFLCLVEAYSFIAKISKSKEHAERSIKSLFGGSGIIAPVDRNLLYCGLRLAGGSSLNIFDSLHYAAALIHNCTEFISYDKDFDNLAIKRAEP